jgi:signal recognition particle GTPase
MSTVKKNASRKICALPEDYALKSMKYRSKGTSATTTATSGTGKTTDISKLVKFIDENIVGRNATFLGPFGRRKGKR